MWPHERPVILAILAGAQGCLLNKIFPTFPNFLVENKQQNLLEKKITCFNTFACMSYAILYILHPFFSFLIFPQTK
jgi:hypothetical protein